ncbi:olfactory receptor 5V1-like [Lithobates pipiens]
MNMSMTNQTEAFEFVLLGFGKLNQFRTLVFVVFFTIYFATLFGNLLIIVLVSSSHHLHTPMYIFLIHLSICDIVFTTNIAPEMLCHILNEVGKMSMANCISQCYLYGSSTVAESLILTAMSYDRYLAICNPLRYTSTMRHGVCLKFVGSSWLVGLLVNLNTCLMLFSSDFCGPNIIDHFICELDPLLKLSCSNTSMLETLILILSIPIIVIPFVFIIVTYVWIFLTVLKIPSSTGRQKTFSTCSSHLTSVSTYYGTLTAIYVVPNRDHALSKALYVLYTVVTPLFNPVIYSLRNQDIRKAFEMLLNKIK